MPYSLTNRAANDLREIAQFGVSVLGRDQAKIYGESFQSCFSMLAENPHAGRGCDHIRLGLHRFEHKSHSVFYIPRDRDILIVRILHASQDPTRYL